MTEPDFEEIPVEGDDAPDLELVDEGYVPPTTERSYECSVEGEE